MEFVEFIAGENDNLRRLDKVLRKMTGDSSLSSIYSLIRKGLIKVNDKKAKENQKILINDKIQIAAFLLENQKISVKTQSEKNENLAKIQPKNLSKIKIVFSNEHIKIINKPYNVNVHGENGLSDLIEAIYKSENANASLSFVPGPLHRLDKKTTGLLAFSNSLKGAEWFSKAISEKIIKKFYIGLCDGKIDKSEFWNDYIFPVENHTNSFHTMKIDNSTQSKNNLAQTICTPLSFGTYKDKTITLCQFQILTGKKHQIRCQSAYHKIPLLGDSAYSQDFCNNVNLKTASQKNSCQNVQIESRQDFFLHAYRMIFPENNPLNIPVELTAEIPLFFKKFLNDSLINWNGELIIT